MTLQYNFGGNTLDGNAGKWKGMTYNYNADKYKADGRIGDYWRDISKMVLRDLMFKTGNAKYWASIRLSDVRTGTNNFTTPSIQLNMTNNSHYYVPALASSGNAKDSDRNTYVAITYRPTTLASQGPDGDPWICMNKAQTPSPSSDYNTADGDLMMWGEGNVSTSYAFQQANGGTMILARGAVDRWGRRATSMSFRGQSGRC